MRKKSGLLLALLVFVLFSGCGGGGNGGTPPYPPAVGLPWPQHDPQFTWAQYNQMMKGLFLINNFGLFQGDSSSYYLHDGLDIVLANETKIFAIADGVVRVVNDAVQNYRTIIIEDANDPYHAWSYTHVGDIRVNVGDAVRQGDWLAVIEFAGIEHIHLTRLERFSRLTDWTDDTVIARQPDGYFTYSDTQAPIFGDAFEFYRNGSDQPLNANALAGAVDIAVLLRDPGEDNHNKVGGLMGMPVGFGSAGRLQNRLSDPRRGVR